MNSEKKTKVCTKCGRELPLDAFSKKSDTNDGLQYHCKDCQREANRNRPKRKKKEFNLYDYVLGSEPTKLNPELEHYTPRVIMSHLRAIGYTGELSLTLRVTL